MEEGVRRGLDAALAQRWARMYGSNADRLFALAERYRDEAASGGLPLEVLVPLVYAVEEEMALKPADFFIRRTGALFFDIDWVRQWKEPAIKWMAAHLGWTPEQQASGAAELDRYLHEAVVPQAEAAVEP